MADEAPPASTSSTASTPPKPAAAHLDVRRMTATQYAHYRAQIIAAQRTNNGWTHK